MRWLLLLSTVAALGAAEDADRVWVAVSVLDLDQAEASEYHGTIAQATLAALLSETPPAWIQLQRVHWHMDEGIESQERVGQAWGYGPSSIFPSAKLTRIVPLSPAHAALLGGDFPAGGENGATGTVP